MTASSTSSREVVLARLVHHMTQQGLPSDLSLRSLANLLGTSHRMLQYHFGTRDSLVAEALVLARQPERDSLAQLAQTQTVAEVARALWKLYIDPSDAPLRRAFIQVLARAVNDPDAFALFVRSLEDWVDVVGSHALAAGYSSTQAPVVAQLIVSSVRGLLIDRMLVTDTSRVDAAFAQMLAHLPVPAVQR